MFFLPKIIDALPVTLMIALVASILGIILGLILAFIRIEKIPVLNELTIVWVSFFRGTPILVQLFIVYFGIPALMNSLGFSSFVMQQMTAVYIAYGLNTAAFLSETFRSSVNAITHDQIEAARSLGFTKGQIYKEVIIPQAVRIAIPDFGTRIINLLKDTAIAFNIGIIDVMGTVKSMAVLVSSQLEGYFAAGLIFIFFSVVLTLLFRWLSNKYSYGLVSNDKPTLV